MSDISLNLKDLTNRIGGEMVGDDRGIILGTCPIDTYRPAYISFVSDRHYEKELKYLDKAVVLIPTGWADLYKIYPQNTYILVDDVISALAILHEIFYQDGRKVEVAIGEDTFIHPSAQIGVDGFRFEQDIKNKTVIKILPAGGVIIGDRVEIGANSVIARATFEEQSTIIGNDVKIDNLVHIGHNAVIRARTLIAAMSCISGSVKIGEDVWIGAGVTVSNGIKVGNRAKLLLNAVAAYDVPDDEIVSGFYAMPHRQWKKADKRNREL